MKICFVFSFTDKALSFENFVEALDRSKFDAHFVLLHSRETEFEKFLRKLNFPVTRIQYKSKSDIPSAIFSLRKYLKPHSFDLLHAHLFEGTLIGLCAAKLLGIKKRFYTRHHSTSHYEVSPRAVWADKLNNRLATHIIAISENVKNVLVQKEGVSPAKVSVIYHGFKLDKFIAVDQEDIDGLRQKYNSTNRGPVIGVISRYLKLKGIDYIIAAYKEIVKTYPNALLILANAKGVYKPEIEKQLSELPLNSFIEIEFENNLYALYKLFDVFVHVPIDEKCEAFGQIYVESLAAEVPSVFTLSGVAPEFVKNRNNALVVDYKSANEIFKALIELLENKQLCESLTQNGSRVVKEKFDYITTTKAMETLYLAN